ncbi:hypothetical protein SLS62_000826 [Diatrype stigma]|uniref:Thiol methyltransferase 1 n=1 Tax=Diatrype stigma TaxID=117547 RepID=A0AAN9YWK1_9PEZI
MILTLDPSRQGSGWNACWEEEWTPWDRGGHSWALYDLLKEHPELSAGSPKNADGSAAAAAARKTALVPGCGRGHDVLLLSSFGYDVYGVDYSPKAIEEARKNAERKPAVEGLDDDVSRGSDERGSITWLSGDFFEDDWLREADMSGRKFDLIYDYTVRSFLPYIHMYISLFR